MFSRSRSAATRARKQNLFRAFYPGLRRKTLGQRLHPGLPLCHPLWDFEVAARVGGPFRFFVGAMDGAGNFKFQSSKQRQKKPLETVGCFAGLAALPRVQTAGLMRGIEGQSRFGQRAEFSST